MRIDDATDPKKKKKIGRKAEFSPFSFADLCLENRLRSARSFTLFTLGFFHSSQVRNNFDKDNRQCRVVK